MSHRLVIPIVLYLRGGEPNVTEISVEKTFGSRQLATFNYWAFGLSRSLALEYLDRPQALAAALAALMDPGDLSAPEHRIECLRRVGRAEVDDAKRFLLANIVETYIELDEAAQGEYQRLLAAEANQEVRTMEMTWADTLRTEGMEQGRAEGMRAFLSELLEERFGPLSQETTERLHSICSTEELSRLHRRALHVASLQEVGL